MAMTDITKCTGEDCPLKETCYRFIAPSEMYQSFFMTPHVKNGKCEYYWGEASQSTYDQLKEIFKTNEK
jgi:hypothetical protein